MDGAAEEAGKDCQAEETGLLAVAAVLVQEAIAEKKKDAEPAAPPEFAGRRNILCIIARSTPSSRNRLGCFR